MKIVPISFIICAALLHLACEKVSEESIKPSQLVSEVDSIVYDIFLTIESDQIIEMKKYHNDTVTENIIIDYLDSIVEKTIYSYGVLTQKNVYYLNDLNYADYSIDSIFYLNRFYRTNYTYDDEGYLIEEKRIPGFDALSDEYDFTIFYYTISEGNRYGLQVQYPDFGSTGSYTYLYSELFQNYDLTTYNNSIVGKTNHNLPDSYGYKHTVKGGYFKDVSYSYKIINSLVDVRIDSIYKDDSVIRKEILYFYYN